jgi:heat shock protein HslJ
VIEGARRVETVAGMPARGATVRFDGTKVGGNTGCNVFGGSFRFDRGFFQATGPLTSTRRACGRPIDRQERNLLALLGERLSVSSTRNGRLVLTGTRGRTLVLARERGRR